MALYIIFLVSDYNDDDEKNNELEDVMSAIVKAYVCVDGLKLLKKNLEYLVGKSSSGAEVIAKKFYEIMKIYKDNIYEREKLKKEGLQPFLNYYHRKWC